MKNLLAQIRLSPEGGFRGFGPLGLEGRDPNQASTIFTNFLSGVIGIITIIGIIWFTFIIFIGAIGIITSGGDKAANENARKRITSGLIGLIVIIAGLFIIDLVGEIFGIKNVLNPAELLKSITGS